MNRASLNSENWFYRGSIIAQVIGPKFKPKQRLMAFSPDLLMRFPSVVKRKKASKINLSKKQVWKTCFSFFPVSGKQGENNIRASAWSSFGLVCRVVIGLQTNDSRFFSIHLFTLRGIAIFYVLNKKNCLNFGRTS